MRMDNVILVLRAEQDACHRFAADTQLSPEQRKREMHDALLYDHVLWLLTDDEYLADMVKIYNKEEVIK